MAITTRTYRFLLEVWVEPREVQSLPKRVRGLVRDIQRGEAMYVGSMAEIASFVGARLDHDGEIPRRWEREP